VLEVAHAGSHGRDDHESLETVSHTANGNGSNGHSAHGNGVAHGNGASSASNGHTHPVDPKAMALRQELVEAHSQVARMEAELHTFDRAIIENTRLSFDRLRWHTERLWHMPLVQRTGVVGLPRTRADVILTGTVIYEAIMEFFRFTELHVSTRGLRFAAVLDEP
jgi:hypothetical protein